MRWRRTAPERPTVTVSTPTERWAVLFLRDMWGLDAPSSVPACDPSPDFAPPARPATAKDAHVLAEAWESSEPALRVFELIEELGQVEAWRTWSNATKRAVQHLGSQGLNRDPFWQAGPDLAAWAPHVRHLEVYPVAGHYIDMRGDTIRIALNLCEDAATLRRALTDSGASS